jgi:beta-glucanase (GH16 family)
VTPDPEIGTVPSGGEPGASSTVDATTPAKAGFVALWSDEFKGTALDLAKWSYTVDDLGGGNHELQYYVALPSNSFIADGNFVLRARKIDYMGRTWTSAKVTTLGTASFTYGYVEARMKVPQGQGMWPAFWMLPKDTTYGHWPTSGEIDIMEILGGNPNTLYGTLHYGQPWPKNEHLSGIKVMPAGTAFSDDFHVYGVDWQEDHIDWYLDGERYATIKATDKQWQTGAQGSPPSTAPGGWPFNKPFYMILNLAVGGDWPGAPDPALTGGELVVDYVRAYQRTATSADGASPPANVAAPVQKSGVPR